MRSNALIPYPCNDFAAAPPAPAPATAPPSAGASPAALLRLTAFAAKKSVAAKEWSLSELLPAAFCLLPSASYWLLAAAAAAAAGWNCS